MSGARPVTDPPPPGTVTYAPATAIRGPVDGAVADRVAQGHVHERPEGADVAHGREPGQHRGPRVADPAQGLLGGAAVDRRDPGPLELADQVGVAVDQPREQGVAGQVEDLGPLGRRLAGVEQPLDPLPPDQQPSSLEDLPGLDVDQPRSPDRQQPAVPVAHALASSVPALLTP